MTHIRKIFFACAVMTIIAQAQIVRPMVSWYSYLATATITTGSIAGGMYLYNRYPHVCMQMYNRFRPAVSRSHVIPSQSYPVTSMTCSSHDSSVPLRMTTTQDLSFKHFEEVIWATVDSEKDKSGREAAQKTFDDMLLRAKQYGVVIHNIFNVSSKCNILMDALGKGAMRCVDSLLNEHYVDKFQRDALLRHRDNEGRTILMHAMQRSAIIDEAVMQKLISPSSINVCDNQGHSALWYAIHNNTKYKHKRTGCLDYAALHLLAQGADAVVLDADGRTPFLYALERSLIAKVKPQDNLALRMLDVLPGKRDTMIRACDGQGKTSAMCIAGYGNIALFEALCGRNQEACNITSQDVQCRDVLNYALEGERWDFAQYLQAKFNFITKHGLRHVTDYVRQSTQQQFLDKDTYQKNLQRIQFLVKNGACSAQNVLSIIQSINAVPQRTSISQQAISAL